MIGCLQTRVRKQPIIALYFEFENELKFYILEARFIAYGLSLPSKSLVRIKTVSTWPQFFKINQTQLKAGDWDYVTAEKHLPALHFTSIYFISLFFGIMDSDVEVWNN